MLRQSGTFIGRPVGGKERRERMGGGKEEEGRGREGRGREEGGRREGKREGGGRERGREEGGKEEEGREEEGGEEKEVYKSYNLHGWRGDRHIYPEGKNFDSSSGSIVSSLRSSR